MNIWLCQKGSILSSRRRSAWPPHRSRTRPMTTSSTSIPSGAIAPQIAKLTENPSKIVGEWYRRGTLQPTRRPAFPPPSTRSSPNQGCPLLVGKSGQCDETPCLLAQRSYADRPRGQPGHEPRWAVPGHWPPWLHRRGHSGQPAALCGAAQLRQRSAATAAP